MKYYSEALNKMFDSEKELIAEEAKARNAEIEKQAIEKKKAEERKNRAAKVEQARIAANEAATNYHKLLADFCKDYGSYHYTIKNPLDNKGYIESEINKAVNVGLFDLAHSLGIL